jgi:hypothetical protein
MAWAGDQPLRNLWDSAPSSVRRSFVRCVIRIGPGDDFAEAAAETLCGSWTANVRLDGLWRMTPTPVRVAFVSRVLREPFVAEAMAENAKAANAVKIE